MLDDFKDDVSVGYKIIVNALKNNTLSHAYLIETNDYERKDEFVLALAKAIICPNFYINDKNCQDCSICSQIDKDEFLELKIINPVGSMIRKDELIKLQIDFSVKPIIGDKKVYIINDADRMNQMASNSILKFLEEPDEGIFALLTVSSVDKMLDTIVSRCQIIRLNKKSNVNNLYDILTSTMSDEKKEVFNSISDDEKEKMIGEFIKFVNTIEFNGLSTICFEKNILNQLQSKEDIELFLNIIILYYEEILKYYLNKRVNLFPGKYLENIERISNNNSYQKICIKIKKVVNLKSDIKVNANTNLLLDRLIINLVR